MVTYTKAEVGGMLEVLTWLREKRLIGDGTLDVFHKAMADEFDHEAVPSMMGPYCVACRRNLDLETYTRHEERHRPLPDAGKP